MPVSKNVRKNRKTTNAKQKKRDELARKRNSAPAVISFGISKLNGIMNDIRAIAGMYVTITKGIPNYAETSPEILKGLKKVIPELRYIIEERDRIIKSTAELVERRAADLEYFPYVSAMENMMSKVMGELLPAFAPVMDKVSMLSDDQDQRAEAEAAIGSLKSMKTTNQFAKTLEQ